MATKICRKIISTAEAPGAVGPYSQAVQVGQTLYISGQLGMDPTSKALVSEHVGAQTHQAMQNMGAILRAAGCTYNNVVKCMVLLKSMNDFAVVNEAYKQYFTGSFPARVCYEVANLPLSGLVEIESVAAVGEITDHKL